ncbi:hypothetical protein GCM10010345_74620 [Streptomyces canarius]|uniref:Uncharacterized protein n=1 Tax=Streptomyces canarius TaxID=285453 RepID=A0ABQ3D7G3_9ACTN|nr:hypothetical protein GCM10010345_74620 [Streptomyces canarius]
MKTCNRVTVLGTGTELRHRVIGGLHEAVGVLWIDPPAASDLDPHATVLAVELDGELKLYRRPAGAAGDACPPCDDVREPREVGRLRAQRHGEQPPEQHRLR